MMLPELSPDPVCDFFAWILVFAFAGFMLLWAVIVPLLQKLWVGRAGFVRRNIIDTDPNPEPTHPPVEHLDIWPGGHGKVWRKL
jgi:hypothetical protein